MADALGWLIKAALSQNRLQGLQIPGFTEPLCLQQFADDTNAIISNSKENAQVLWHSLDIFCKASGSVINHGKTRCYSASGVLPSVIERAGCKIIRKGEVFRLLGIPMGF